jgi:hypothetical protein
MSRQCPYCGVPLGTPPTRKRKCEACGQYIYVRAGEPVTGDRAGTIDWLKNLQLSQAVFDEAETALTAQFGHKPEYRDVLWRLLNNRVTASSSADSLKMTYRWMARFVFEEGRDPSPYLQQSHEAELLGWKRDLSFARQLRVTILAAGPSSCPACRQLDGHTLSLDDALASHPLPVKACTNDAPAVGAPGWCRCCYLVDTTSMF